MDKDSSDLNDVIEQMCKPLKALPFHKVIEALSQKKVIRFDGSNLEHSEVLDKLSEAASVACMEINRNGILRPRPNEVGNDIEP
ncbi:MAG: hypothetical protein HZB62_00005 [Nitrospirae bacterium]|nr:hypothetical protein [Nitrospirota bacterium]